jgi:dihydrofolate reductase
VNVFSAWKVWNQVHQQPPITPLCRSTSRENASLVGELRMFRVPVVVGGGTPFLPPVTEVVPLDLVETRTFGSRVIYERYRQTRDELD